MKVTLNYFGSTNNNKFGLRKKKILFEENKIQSLSDARKINQEKLEKSKKNKLSVDYLIKNKILISAGIIPFMYIMLIVITCAAGSNSTNVTYMSFVAGVFDVMTVLYIGLMGFGYLIKVDNSRSWGFYGILFL